MSLSLPGPAALGIDPAAGVPSGFGIEMEPDTKEIEPGVLFGGSPVRILRVNGPGVAAIAALATRPVRSEVEGTIARRLTDANLAHPVPPVAPPAQAVTVVIPVKDRTAELDRCLASLGASHPVVVVDDGSSAPERTAEVCRRHGARLLRHEVTRGPGPARNTGLAAVDTPLVAFVDSDCVPGPHWISRLLGHLADPLVACVAARMLPLATPDSEGAVAKYAEARLPLDLGSRPATVAPGRRVAYLPSANLLARRSALGDGFDESMRYGEDVDLVWRLVEAGWRVRYEPAVEVRHEEPVSGRRLLRRRFEYGTSAAPLEVRHPGSAPSLVLQPWPTLAVAALLARRPVAAVAAYGAGARLLEGRLRRAGLPSRGVWKPSAVAVTQTGLGVGRWLSQFALAPTLAVVWRPGGRRPLTRWGRRLVVVSLLLAPPLDEWRKRRPALGAATFTVASLLDEAAYGAGVWAGCRRVGNYRAVFPKLSHSFLSRKERR